MYDDNEYQRSRRQQRLAAGLCGRCGKIPPDPGLKHCTPCREWARARFQREHATPALRQKRTEQLKHWRHEHRDAFNAQMRRSSAVQRDKLRTLVVDHYGARCACCGEVERAFLTLDHINNDGNAHRKEVGKSYQMYSWIKRNGFPPIFQVLCWNCNLAKHILGACPHQVKQSEEP